MPNMARKWTRDMVLALPDDGNRYELFDGELLNERLVWHPAGAVDALDLHLPAFFSEIWGRPS